MKFFDVEKKINKGSILKLETIFGYKIPEEYNIHLLKFNGGRCKPNIFYFKENDNLTSSDIDWFLALYDGEFDNIFDYIEIYKDKIPSHFLPMAHDSGGNLICISCGIEDYGYIYFWNHEFNELGNNEIWLIEKSFNEFLKNLK